MNRILSFGLAVAATLIVSLCLAGNGNARRKEISSTRRVVIDGRSFVADESSRDAGSILRRELDRLGVALPDGLHLPEEPVPPHPALEGRLKGSRPGILEPFRLPAGFTAEHTLRMEGEGTTVDLVFGTLDTPGPSVRSLLRSSGWESVPAGNGSGGIHVLRFRSGKETCIACLDDADGTFLLFREAGG
jgi:hypothetical protein